MGLTKPRNSQRRRVLIETSSRAAASLILRKLFVIGVLLFFAIASSGIMQVICQCENHCNAVIKYCIWTLLRYG